MGETIRLRERWPVWLILFAMWMASGVETDASAATSMRSTTQSMATEGTYPAASSAQAHVSRSFDLPAQPLDDALAAFGLQSGLQVSVDAQLVRGLSSQPVHGSYVPEEALRDLLQGTGLTFRTAGDSTVVLEKATPLPSATTPQPTTAPPPFKAEESRHAPPIVKVPEIIMLGDKLDRSIEDIPQSVSLFTADNILRQANTTSAQEVFYRTPNVSVGEPANGSFQIRGVNNNNVVRNTDTGANGSITVLSNLVPISFSSADYFPPSLWDIKTVEVFKGPQSVTQGPNSLAGAVLFNYQEPEFNYEGRSRFTYASYNTLNAALAQNLKLIDDMLALRFSYERQTSDGAIDNKLLNIGDWANVDRNTFRGQALLRPFKNKDLEAKLTVTSDWFGGNATPSHGRFTPFFDRINSHDVRAKDDIKGTTAGLVVNGRISDALRVTSISGFNHLHLGQIFDGGGTPDSDGTVDFFRKENVGTQELRMNYETRRFRGLVGVFGQYGSYESGFDFVIPGAGIFIKSITDKRWNASLFGDAEYDLTDRLSIGAGLRIHHEDYRITMGQNVFGSAIGSQTTERSDTVPLPKVHISYQLFDPLKVGLMVSRGFRSGGGSVTYSPQFAGVETSSYGPEHTWNYEAFFRSIWMDGKLTVNGNVFFVDWQDMIVSIPTIGAFGTTNTVTVNAASARTHGFEVQAVYTPIEQVSVPLGLGYTHTEFTDFPLTPTENIAGQAFPNAPAWSLSAGLDYRAQNGIFATSTFSWRSSTYAQVQNVNQTRLQPRELLSAKVGYAAEHWSAYLFGSNLLNDNYATLLFLQPGAPFVTGNSGLPRMIGFGFEGYW